MTHLDPERLAALARGLEPDDVEAEHLLDCAACAGAAAPGDAPLGALLEALPLAGPALGASVERVEARLLAELDGRRRRRLRRLTGGALTAAVALAAAWAVWSRATPPGSHAQVSAASGQVAAVSTGDDEVLSLRGEATFAVTKLPAGHRFRVRVGGDEVEVRGTRFVVRGEQAIDEVTVTEGLVEVRPAGAAPTAVPAGERWTRSTGPTTPASAPATTGGVPATTGGAPATTGAPTAGVSGAAADSPPGASTAAARPGAAAHPGEAPIEQMQRGMDAFDAGNYGAASSLLDRAVAAEPSAPWARDARALSGAARVMLAPVDRVASLGAGVAAFDAAVKRASRTGDSARAAAARLGAARASMGEARRKRYCALQSGGPPSAQAEIERECRR